MKDFMRELKLNHICYSSFAGAVAQLGERHTCTVDVAGSIPVSSTTVVSGLLIVQGGSLNCIN